MMNREQFYNFMKYSVQDLLNERGVEGNVQIEEVMKNNDQVLTGLVIRGNGECISPCIYLNDMFERYQEGYPLQIKWHGNGSIQCQNRTFICIVISRDNKCGCDHLFWRG